MANENLARIPEDWSVDNVSSFLDYDILPGKVAIKLPPSSRRECDGHWYDVKPGDHIVAKIKIKVDTLAGYTHNPNDPWSWKGARLGMDFNGGGVNIASYPLADNSIPYGAPNMYVDWGTPGTVQKTYDILVPSDSRITSMALWVEVQRYADAANAWFYDAELYINPTETPPPPPVQYVVDIWQINGGTTTPTGTQTVASGSVVTITEKADAGYTEGGWLVNNQNMTGNTLTLTITANTTVIPIFNALPVTPPPPAQAGSTIPFLLLIGGVTFVGLLVSSTSGKKRTRRKRR